MSVLEVDKFEEITNDKLNSLGFLKHQQNNCWYFKMDYAVNNGLLKELVFFYLPTCKRLKVLWLRYRIPNEVIRVCHIDSWIELIANLEIVFDDITKEAYNLKSKEDIYEYVKYKHDKQLS